MAGRRVNAVPPVKLLRKVKVRVEGILAGHQFILIKGFNMCAKAFHKHRVCGHPVVAQRSFALFEVSFSNAQPIYDVRQVIHAFLQLLQFHAAHKTRFALYSNGISYAGVCLKNVKEIQNYFRRHKFSRQ